MKAISTVRDAMIQNRDAKEAVAYMLEFQELSKKVKLWEKKVQKLPGCDHKGILALYHETLPNLPAVEIWNDTRAGYLRQRWREVALDLSKNGPVSHADMLAWWKQYFELVKGSKFLTGKKQQKDKPPFLADLEWIIKPLNFTKIIEGKYHRE